MNWQDPGVLPVTNITPPPRPGGAGTPRGKQPRPKVLVMSGADTVDIKEFRAKVRVARTVPWCVSVSKLEYLNS